MATKTDVYDEDYDQKVSQHHHEDIVEKKPQTLAIAAPDTPRTVCPGFLDHSIRRLLIRGRCISC